MALEDGKDGDANGFPALERGDEHRCLRDGQAYVQAQRYQHAAGEKWQPPAKAKKLRRAEPAGKHKEDRAGKEEAARGAQLRKHAVPGALARGCVFSGKQHGAAPLATEADTLAKAAQCKQNGGEHARCFVGGQHADDKRGEAHGGEREDERGFAANTVAKVAEER